MQEAFTADEWQRWYEMLDVLTVEAWQRWYETLAVLQRNPAIGAASARAFSSIWLRCQARVTECLRLYLPDLAKEFGKKIEAAKGWLDRLEAAGVLLVRNRELSGRPPEGWIILDVYHPNPELREVPDRIDPQRRFGFMEEHEPEASPIATPAGRFSSAGKRGGKTPAFTGGISAGKPPRLHKAAAVGQLQAAAASGEVPLGQYLRAVAELEKPGRDPPPKRAKRGSAPDIRYRNLNQNLNLDIGEIDQKAFEDRIHRELADPQLQAQPVRKVAAKLAEGSLDWTDVQRAIDNARQAFRDDRTPAAWIYFIGAMRRAFEERGWTWRRKRKGR